MSFLTTNFFGILLPVDLLLICIIVWIYTQQQANNIPEQLRKRWLTLTRWLMAIPGVVLLVVGLLIGLVWRTEPETRFIHALLILSYGCR
jgi:hypothetical protein